jgi:hypothetical protein
LSAIGRVNNSIDSKNLKVSITAAPDGHGAIFALESFA